MGATPTPMPLGETFSALAQGVIDGVENPVSVLYGQRFHEEAKYLNKIGYITNTAMFVGGEAFFSTLSEPHLQIVHETGYEAGLYSQQLMTSLDDELIGKMQQEGVEIVEVDTEPFRALTQPVYASFPEWSDGLYEEIQGQLQ